MPKDSENKDDKLDKLAKEVQSKGYSYLSDEVTTTTMPERVLLAAVLERAFRDLFAEDPAVVRDAVVWFRSKSQLPTCINFRDCIDHLQLSGSQIKYLRNCVELAMYGEFEAEGETGRARAVSLASGAWHPGKKNPAIQWRGRVVRYH